MMLAEYIPVLLAAVMVFAARWPVFRSASIASGQIEEALWRAGFGTQKVPMAFDGNFAIAGD